MTANSIIKYFQDNECPENLVGMQRYGIRFKKAFGVKMTGLRELAKKIKKDHSLALELWKSEYHEAKILASIIADPDKMTAKLMDEWANEFYSWDLCDQCCMNLFRKSPDAWNMVFAWCESPHEFKKRAAFALVATLSVHDKKSSDAHFGKLFPLIKNASTDERNLVKKSVNWALRQIGKRNLALNRKAIGLANELLTTGSKSACWIASDALRELNDLKLIERIKNKASI